MKKTKIFLGLLCAVAMTSFFFLNCGKGMTAQSAASMLTESSEVLSVPVIEK